MNDDSLADFQDALNELLMSGKSEAVILDALKTDPRFKSYREYIDGFDLDMISVASELVGRWSKRTSNMTLRDAPP